MSAISQAELIYIGEKSSMPERNFRVLEDFCSRLTVIDCGQKAAAHYGEIGAVLGRKGTPIGVNDLQMAGRARSEGTTLVTNNLKAFERVDGLRLENWI